jgi:hypothetical protein
MITGNYDTLLRQAPMTVSEYLREVMQEIDSRCGEGYAKKNPEMVCRLVEVAAGDYETSAKIVALQEAVERLCGALSEAVEALSS